MTKFEQLATNLAVSLINLPNGKIDDFINTALMQIVQYLGMDRATFYQFRKRGFFATHCWARPGVPTKTKFYLPNSLPYIYSQVKDSHNVRLFSLSKFPDEAARDKATFAKDYGPRFMVCNPIFANQKNIGYISFGSLDENTSVPKDKINKLTLLTTLIANALLKQGPVGQYNKFPEPPAFSQQKSIADFTRKSNQILPGSLIIGQSNAIHNLLALARKVAPSDTTVLIMGETGTGKELLARYIHNLSLRQSRPLISANCAVFSRELINSEFFGHEKGAFTGASQRRQGLFETANDSTLFLDESGELPNDVQANLLRVLQEKQFTRIGSCAPIATNIRLIAATNRDLPGEVRAGRFRQDLYYRLNVFPIYIPPLRERPEDIPFLVNAFVREFNELMNKKITSVHESDIMDLQGYSWPGNVRELRNVVERAMIMADSQVLRLPVPAHYESPGHELSMAAHDPILSLEDAEKKYIRMALQKTHGRISGAKGAAALLKINPKTLESRMKKLGITRF